MDYKCFLRRGMLLICTNLYHVKSFVYYDYDRSFKQFKHNYCIKKCEYLLHMKV